MEADDSFQHAAIRRIYVFTIGLSVIGAIAGTMAKDPAWGASFLIGGAASAVNFRLLHQLVESLGPGGQPRRRVAVYLCLRYLLLSVGIYVIVMYFGVRLTGLLAGLLVAGAAVMAEILYEIIHART